MATLDAEVLRTLKFSGLAKDNLKELVGLVSRVDQTGLRPWKVFPYGIPYPDGVRVCGTLGPDKLGILAQLLKNPRRVDYVKAFPRGIPPLELQFEVEVGLR